MKNLLSKLVYLKHWQFFLLYTTFFLIFPMFFVPIAALMFSGSVAIAGMMISVLAGLVMHLAWIYYAGLNLHKAIEKNEKRPSIDRFKFYFGFIVFTYFYAFFFQVYAHFAYLVSDFWLLLELLFLALSIFAGIYIYWFVAYSLLVAEKRKVSILRSIPAFLLTLFFYPIGIWFIQPRMQKVIE